MTHIGESKRDVHRVRHKHKLTAFGSTGSRRCSHIRMHVHLLVFLFQRGTEENGRSDNQSRTTRGQCDWQTYVSVLDAEPQAEVGEQTS